jgi:ech hydrogenase subunit F
MGIKREEPTMFKMTPTILRNFVGKRATRLYPAVVRPPFPDVRGALTNDMASCNFCGICAAKCPSRCINVDKKNATWQCDPFACVFCGVCVDACKTGALRQDPLYRRPSRAREHIFLQGAPVKGRDDKRQTADMAM